MSQRTPPTVERTRLPLLGLAALIVACSLSTGCSTIAKQWKSLISGKDSDDKKVATPRFSEQENYKVNTSGFDKQYRRMNRQKLEEEADLKEDAGSLWVMEGQGAYLFSQNQMRTVGDILNVKIEGGPRAQLLTKVKVISRLLDKLENPTQRGLASQAGAASPQQAAAPGTPGAPSAAAPGAAPAANANPAQVAQPVADGQPGENKSEPNFAVQSVPTKIVEQLKDGSYRVRGMQPFMIGKREYKVIVTGIVRGEDFDENGIEAAKLLDPQFDIVSSRKGASL